MKWPPSKAWTSVKAINGFNHFVAINYGGKLDQRWVNLVSVVESNVFFKISWIEMNNSSKWIQGWENIDITNHGKEGNNFNFDKCCDLSCLYPSNDSGLTIPIIDGIELREW